MKNDLISELQKVQEIKEFCTKNKLKEKDITNNLSQLFLYKDNIVVCNNCNGNDCKSATPLMKPWLEYKDGFVKVYYEDCEVGNKINNGKLELLCASGKDETKMDYTEVRVKAFNIINNFKNNYQSGTYTKGIYLFGQFGVGKTFIFYRFAKDLAKDGHSIIFVYYPDLVRQIKSLIGTIEFEKTILKLKKVELLFLDDLGGENNTAFIRDEVLGPILQYRMDNSLPLFITSNYSQAALKAHFSDTVNEENNPKAARIYERIKYLTLEVELKGKDYRNSI